MDPGCNGLCRANLYFVGRTIWPHSPEGQGKIVTVEIGQLKEKTIDTIWNIDDHKNRFPLILVQQNDHEASLQYGPSKNVQQMVDNRLLHLQTDYQLQTGIK